MSGTPLSRSDGADMRLIAQTGPILYEISNKHLIEIGVSVQPVVELIKISKPVLPRSRLSYAEVERRGIIENIHLNSKVSEKAQENVAKGKQVLILVEKIAHGKLLKKLINVPCKFISGQETTDERKEVLNSFENGDLPIVIATTILDEGVDVPCIDVIILACGGKAEIRLLQRIGRGLRKNAAKEELLIIDFAHFTHKWLLDHSLRRLKIYKREDCFKITSQS